MHPGVDLLKVLLVFWFVGETETLECFSCTDIPIISDCSSVIKCSVDEECFTDARGLGNDTQFTLGCRHFAQCIGTNSSASIVGRALDNSNSQSSLGCQQCCGTDYCNKKICTQTTPITTGTDGQCHDDPDYNCELIAGTFNICGDVAKAKTVCRKWCGLCSLVDGHWSSWSPWTGCSVSCGQGQRSRNRLCTEPRPSHGGLDCVGSKRDVSNCLLGACPVHGGWSGWSSWGSCSVSCGIGLQGRSRTCSRPFPGPDGNHCFGDAREDRVCLPGACKDGAWSSWTPWSVCSASCNGGLVSRSRSCDNPSPSILGKQCVGQDEEYHTCNTHACPTSAVAFSLSAARNFLSNGRMDSGVLLYINILTNAGNGYNVTSGEFKCPIPGIYSFFISFLHTTSAGSASCYIRQNGRNMVNAVTSDAATAAGGEHSASVSVILALVAGDVVDVYCDGFTHIYKGSYAVFNGVLVAPK